MEMSEPDLLEQLSCQVHGSSIEYKTLVKHSFVANGTYADKREVVWKFGVRDTTIQISEEKLLYDETNFIADVGGYLGLLLGVSAVTLYEWAELACDTALRSMKKTRHHPDQLSLS